MASHLLRTTVNGIILVYVLDAHFVSIYKLSGTSMIPTYYNDVVVVNKFNPLYKAGDVVVFKRPDCMKMRLNTKRIAGVAGDKIEYERNGQLTSVVVTLLFVRTTWRQCILDTFDSKQMERFNAI